MKKEQISDALNELDDGIIEETEAVRESKRRPRRRWITWAAAAACLTLVVFAGVRSFSRQSLPMLQVKDGTSSEGYGYEGFWAYDISELTNGNPWNETANLSTLPVYRNRLTHDENFNLSGGDPDKMLELLMDVAVRLGLDTDTLTVTDNVPDEETQQIIAKKMGGEVPEGYFDPTELSVKTDGLQITVDQEMNAVISFDPAVSLPEEYNFTYHSSYDDTAAVAEYLKETYKDLIGIEDPQVNIYGGGYDIEFYDGSGNMTDQIINYNFNEVKFYCDDDGKLSIIRINRPDLSDKVGDYPIITADEAKELLANGNYITTVPYEMPGVDFVAKVELIYRTGRYEEYFMPYYRFYVELPETDGDIEEKYGLKTYGVYYVPAVDGAYLANMPVWDGTFNF